MKHLFFFKFFEIVKSGALSFPESAAIAGDSDFSKAFWSFVLEISVSTKLHQIVKDSRITALNELFQLHSTEMNYFLTSRKPRRHLGRLRLVLFAKMN